MQMVPEAGLERPVSIDLFFSNFWRLYTNLYTNKMIAAR